jgi:DNA end-binding protein Ku
MRSFWSGSISFGLVNIPVNVHPAAKPEQLAFRFLHEKDMGRIHNERVCDKCGETVPYEDVIRGYEYEKDRYAAVTKEDLESAVPEAAKTIDILDFVEEKEIDPMFFDKPYYLVPEKKGVKAYILLREALKKTGKVGIAKVVFHTREHLAAVRGSDEGLVLEVMHFASELKKPKDLGLPEGGARPGKKELEMAEELIANMTTSFNPSKYHDDYREHLEKLIEDKLHGKKLKAPERKKAPDNVIDIMSKLKASLAQKGRKATKPQKRRSA